MVTHSHPDHFGGAGLLAQESGGDIVVSDRFRTFFDPEDIDDPASRRRPTTSIRRRTRFPTCASSDRHPGVGRSSDRRPKLGPGCCRTRNNSSVVQASVALLKRVADCDHITLGGRDWVGLFTPGHTDDHLCLYDEEGGVLLSGDQVLPTITPHISGLIPGNPLFSYLESLDRLSDLPHVSTVLPAHGQPFHDLPGRAREIKVHHDERLERLLDL